MEKYALTARVGIGEKCARLVKTPPDTASNIGTRTTVKASERRSVGASFDDVVSRGKARQKAGPAQDGKCSAADVAALYERRERDVLREVWHLRPEGHRPPLQNRSGCSSAPPPSSASAAAGVEKSTMPMRSTLVALTLTLLLSTGHAEERPALPADAQALIQGFRVFEARELKAAQDRIEPRRKELLTALQRQLDRETRGGSLNAALAIKEQIASLSQSTGAPAQDTAAAPVGTAAAPNAEEAAVAGRKAKIHSANGYDPELQFNGDKTIKVSEGQKVYPGQPYWFARWSAARGRIIIWNGAKEEVGYIPFDPTRKSSTLQTTHKAMEPFDRAKVSFAE